jgi:3'-5' exonuclease
MMIRSQMMRRFGRFRSPGNAISPWSAPRSTHAVFSTSSVPQCTSFSQFVDESSLDTVELPKVEIAVAPKSSKFSTSATDATKPMAASRIQYVGNSDDAYFDDDMPPMEDYQQYESKPAIDAEYEPSNSQGPGNSSNEPLPLSRHFSRAALEVAKNLPKDPFKTVDDYSSMEDYFEAEGIRSRPKEGGTWNIQEPLAWTRDFGRRSPEYERILQPLIALQPGDEGYTDVSDLVVPEVCIVRTKEQAHTVMARLMAADPSIVHACDTEVMDIDVSSVGPVGNGYCTCVSIYSGPDFDYGLGHGPGATLWIDNLDDSCGLIQEFKAWLEDERFKKVWHNYGFDRHILWNEGIDLRGFWGDTMHMARLQDSSRAKTEGAGGYGLEALTSALLKERKQPMKELFGIKRLKKDGSEGAMVDVPPVEVLQRDPRFRPDWIKYSAKDAKSTWLLRENLTKKLKKMLWMSKETNMYDYYELHMRPFGEVLTDMERRGIRVDAKDYLAKVEIQAREDRARHVEVFRQWAFKMIGPDGLAMNTASSTQLGTFLFGGAENLKTKEKTETIKEFKVSREEIPEDALEAYRLQEEAAKESARKVEHQDAGKLRVWENCFRR